MAFRAVIFDFDGVLVDSEPLHFRAMRESLLPEGIVLDEEGYLASYISHDDRTAIRLALEKQDDVSRGKPDPQPYLAAMARLAARAPGLLPAECVAIEDSVGGIASARAAGMAVVGVAHTYPEEKLGAAHRVVASLERLEGDALLGG